MDSIPTYVHIIGNFGFPIAISLYLLIRFEKRISRLEIAIHQLAEVIKNWGGKG